MAFESDTSQEAGALVRKLPAGGPSPVSRLAAGAKALRRRLLAGGGDEVEARAVLEGLSRRTDAVEGSLREAAERNVAFWVNAGDRAAALEARLADAESRLAELEVDRARLREALGRLGAADERPASVADEVAFWRRRLAGSPAAGAPPLTRHGEVARVLTDVGALLLPGRDEVMLSFMRQFGEWEKQESDLLRSLLKPGMTFVDVGAHVGYMSMVAAGAVGAAGRGFAFEPEPGNFRLLLANLAAHGVENVHAVRAAAWPESTRLSLSLCTENTGDHRAYAMPDRESVDVLAVAIDDVLPDDVAVDVVKVDAQGTDDLAIRGMERTLARSRPVLVVEFWPDGIRQRGGDPAEVLAYYRDLRYEVEVLGPEPRAASTPPDVVLDAAESSPTEFCTLVLTPAP